MQDDPRQFETGSLVESIRNRVDPNAPSRKSAGMKPSITSLANSVSLDPMTIEEASKLVRRFLAGYPNLGAHDPEGYIEAMIETMSLYPPWAGERVIIKVDEVNPEFPPSERQLRTWLDDAVRPFKFKQEWEARVKKQLEERSEYEAANGQAQSQLPPQEGQSYTNFDQAVKLHGRPIGPFEHGRTAPYRG